MGSGGESMNQHASPDCDNPTWSANPFNHFPIAAEYAASFNHAVTSVAGLRTHLSVSSSSGHYRQACGTLSHKPVLMGNFRTPDHTEEFWYPAVHSLGCQPKEI